MSQQNMFTAQWSQQQTFYAYIDSQGNIASQTYQGSQVIGVSLQKYKQMEELAEQATSKAEEYKKQLIDAGLIVVPLTEQQQIAQLSQQVAELTTIIQNMGALNELKQSSITSTNNVSREQFSDEQDKTSSTNSVSVPSIEGRVATNDTAIQHGDSGHPKSVGNIKVSPSK